MHLPGILMRTIFEIKCYLKTTISMSIFCYCLDVSPHLLHYIWVNYLCDASPHLLHYIWVYYLRDVSPHLLHYIWVYYLRISHKLIFGFITYTLALN